MVWAERAREGERGERRREGEREGMRERGMEEAREGRREGEGERKSVVLFDPGKRCIKINSRYTIIVVFCVSVNLNSECCLRINK